MLITISVPDNTVNIYYSTQRENEQGYISENEPIKITFNMITKVEQEWETHVR